MRFADQRRRYALCRERLMQRRNVVVRTLVYVNDERKNLKTNPPWKPSLTQRKRLNLLDEIYGWYNAELKKINAVLERAPDEPHSEKNTRRVILRRLNNYQ